MIQVVLWKWTDRVNRVRASYDSVHVNAAAKAIRQNIRLPHRIVCVTDDPSGIDQCDTHPLWEDCRTLTNATKGHLPSCYRRLKLYDPATQHAMRIGDGDTIASIDLDMIVMRDLTPMFEVARSFRFMGWAVAGPHHPKVFNGSLQIFKAGDLEEIWTQFDPDHSPRETFNRRWLGSDQSWISMNLVGRDGCDGFSYPTVASYSVDYRRTRTLSAKTRIMFFNGRTKPWHPETRRDAYWVTRYWQP